MCHWLLQVLIALDQLVNALLGGWADETLSSRAWRFDPCSLPLVVAWANEVNDPCSLHRVAAWAHAQK